jgi:LPXTG-site transpeptidase (sortase) family protein
VVLSWSAGLNPLHDEGQNAQAVSPDRPSAAAGVAAMTMSEPVRLRIPSIGIDSALIGLGIETDGTLEEPPQVTPAGWFTHSPTPGEPGPAIIAGHVARNAVRGVFFDLHNLSAGSKVFVDRKDGSTAVFRVVSLGAVDKEHFPTAAVYGNIDYAGLRLITCADFDDATGKYTDNFVAFAKLVSTG